jgi:hypothetical protein
MITSITTAMATTTTAADTSRELLGDMITLVSNDGFEFIIEKSWAMASKTLKSMFSESSDQFMESLENRVTFEKISGKILEKVCLYFHYKHRYEKEGPMETSIPDFVIEPELAFDLLMAAHFLDC